MDKLTPAERHEIRSKGLLPRVWILLFGTPKVRTRKGKLKSLRHLGIMLVMAIGVITAISGATYEVNGVSKTIIESPKTIGVLNMVGAILTTVGILAFKVKTFGLTELFGKLDD